MRLLERHSSVPAEERAEIGRFINATKSHLLPAGEWNRDLEATLDIDMSILGAPAQAYRAYAEGVRKEYCPAVTTEQRFTAGRVAFLAKVLDQPSIFHTSEGITRWEGQARENIAREIESLRAGQGLLWRVVSAVLSRR